MYSVGRVEPPSEWSSTCKNYPVACSFSLSHLPCHTFTQEMIDEADKDGDGEVSEAEFLRIMKKTNMY